MTNSLRPHGLQHIRLPCPSLSPTVCSLMSIDSMMPSKHLILSPPSPPALNLSQHQGVFQWVESSHQVVKELEFQLNISSSNEYSGLISFKIDRFDLLVAQRILESLLQHHNLKASVLWHSAFCVVQLSHPYMTTGKKHSFD